MRTFTKITQTVFLSLALCAGVVGVHANTTHAAADQTLVKTAKVAKFGSILISSKGYALYYWAKEKNGKILCTDATCVNEWPVLYVPKNTMPPATVKGIMGKFSVVMRPDGTHQLAFNGHPLYTYVGDKPGQVLCDNVNDWHVVRLM